MGKMILGLKTGLATGVLFSLMATSSFAAQVTEEKAKSIALENAGVKEKDTSYILAKSGREDNQPIFEVEFLTNDFQKYEYEILVEDGIILEVGYELKKDAGKEGAARVTLEQAKSIAASHAGQTEETVSYDESKTEYDDNRLVHEVDFHTSDQKEYSYEIDAATGKILSWDYDGKGYLQFLKNNGSGSAKSAAPITLEDAKAMALKKAGLKETDVVWKNHGKEYEDGRLVYKGEFLCNGMEYEFEVDAATGNFLDWEVEMD